MQTQTTTTDSPPPAQKFAKAKAIAARLGICPKTLFRWADSGTITRYKINDRVVLFDEEQVFDYVRGNKVPTPTKGQS